ncbi:hypothetical protein CYLTODRAFT_491490 [Cylindrobasidium torrendii FP15055 ss-10]|uniref:Zinc-ribbon 15 domain-containing protein n=1 Tax=Cylindrobasidium torrendii FP15055 ss-10 TaxID=1314674 RepID=A0A0D7BA79_9AGAR|nr:hypothetical protein CYLTODRAFT_491490 [Cylindrobasidium torrendii FP15055 ss-10]
MPQTVLGSSPSLPIDIKSGLLIYTRLTADTTRDDGNNRQCLRCRQGTVIAVLEQTFLKLLRLAIPLSARERIWRCTACPWRSSLTAKVQPPIVHRPFSFSAVKEVNPIHLIAESWHRPPSIVEQQPLTLPSIRLDPPH